MMVYRINPSQVEVRRRRAVKQSIILSVGTFTLSTAATAWLDFRRHRFSFPLDRVDWLLFLLFVAIMGGVVVWSAFRSIRKARKNVDQFLSVEITVDETSVTKRQEGGVDITLPFAAITRIEEYKGAFKICTDSLDRNIVVPRDLEAYDELKTYLRQRSPAPLVDKLRSPVWEKLAIVAFLASLVLLLAGERLLVVMTASVFIVCFLTWGAQRVYRDPNLTLKFRRKALLGWIILTLVCVARVWTLWGI